MKKIFFPSLKKQRGQSLIEMGLSMVVILMLLAGAINTGYGFFALIAVRDAAEEGALYGSLNPTLTANITARARAASTIPSSLSSATVTVSTPNGTCPGKPLTVTVSLTIPVFMPLAGLFVGNTFPVQANSTSTILTSATTGC